MSSTDVRAGNSGTILIVEDNEFLRRPVSKTLQQCGFSVFEAGDGASALSLFLDHVEEIDIVLLDITLPVMSGREVFEKLKRIRPDVRVIITTALDERTFVGSSHPWAFVRKPYRIIDLVRLVETAGRHQSSDE